MFTGIVEEIGEITASAPAGDGLRLTVRAPKAVSDAAHGDSIAVSGVCLTVVDRGDDWFAADVMRQTLDMWALAEAAPGTPVNLERAMTAHGRLGGHVVQGHVDGTGLVLEVRPGDAWSVLRISLPADLAPLVADKGSIAVDGVSLTVSAVSPTPSASALGAGAIAETSAQGSDVREAGIGTGGSAPQGRGGMPPGHPIPERDPERQAGWFEVSLIPETLAATTLGAKRPGDPVNLETDVLARHVQRLLAFAPNGGIR